MTLGKRLTQLREARQLSQSEVARAIHLTQQAIDNYEKGTREPKGEILVRLARFYGVSTDYLLGLADDPTGAAVETPRSGQTADDELYVVFRGRRQELSPEYKRVLIDMMEAAHRKMEEERKSQEK